MEPDSDCGNDNSSVKASQVPLYVTVGSTTNEPLSGKGMALAEGSNGVRRTEEGGPGQRPALPSTQMETIPNIIIDNLRQKLELVEITVVEIQRRHSLRSLSFFPACRRICLVLSQRETS